jgi:DNA-binding IclR family transcriptional regulator
MRASIPDDVRRFILTSVPSVPYLEAMLLLRGEPDAAWDAAALARRLYLQPGRAADLLQQLADAAFVVARPDGWRWQPSPEAADRIAELAHVYSENLLGVTELIHSREDRRAHQFADAFRLRRDDKSKEE